MCLSKNFNDSINVNILVKVNVTVTAREDSRLLDVVSRKLVFTRRRILKDLSRSVQVRRLLVGCKGSLTAGAWWDRNHGRIQLEL